MTLRLTSGMYHRFHAPHDCRVEQVTYISGDTWNVNPIALKRVERLFCKNERAVLRTTLAATGDSVTLVPVAAILVASIRLHFLDVLLNLKHRGPNVIACDASFRKGEEMGWFQHGSTIIVFAPDGFALCDNVREGATDPHGTAADAAAVIAMRRSGDGSRSCRVTDVDRDFIHLMARRSADVPPAFCSPRDGRRAH